jgi:hypothetical protein
MDFPNRHEYRLETNPLVADVAMRAGFGAVSDVADCADMPFIEAVFVAIDDNLVLIDIE